MIINSDRSGRGALGSCNGHQLESILLSATVVAGGWAHPPDDLANSMTGLLGSRGYDVSVVTDPAELVLELQTDPDLVVFGACWFAMTDKRYTATQRAEFAVTTSDELKAALRSVIDAGVPMLAMHTAVLCFDGWPEWGEWLGAEWNWAASFHPAPTTISVTVDPRAKAGADFSVIDEEYQGLNISSQVDVIATSAAHNPLAWTCPATRTRVAVDLLGHDERSLDHVGHQRLLHGLLDWLTRKGNHVDV